LNCPACRRGLPAGPLERCPFCGAILAAATEGALAADPRLDLSARVEPVREVPGLRRRDRTWKDEVRDRVQQRRQQRGVELPLFPEAEEPSEEVAPEPPVAAPMLLGDEPPAPVAHLRELGDAPVADPVARERPTHRARLLLDEQPVSDAPFRDDPFDEPRAERWPTAPESAPVAPVERPARAGERAQAAALDLALLLGMWSVVVYFASRAAQVTVAGLLPSWPYLVGYLAALGLIYAGYFTGTTGQTLGKIALGLRVVDTAGQPPGYLRASLRAMAGAVGVLLAGSGLVTVLMDPARRALHDRLLDTRVVKG
jgi:uncharacterized RDD family membrane protein YckC